MTVHRLIVVAVAVLCTCVLVVAGCGSADTGVTANTTSTAATTETVRLYPVRVDGKWGFIDNTGTLTIEPRFDNVEVPWLYGPPDIFSEGLAAVAVGVNGDEKWGFIDTSGTMVIEPRFDYAGSFSEGLAAVGNKTGMDGELYMEFGYIDTSGAIVIPIERNTSSSFSEALAMFTVMDVGYPSYFSDKTGAPVLGPFDFALNFCEGLAYVEWGDRCGYIDKNGDRVIELPEGFGRCQHTSCCFSEGLALVASFDGAVEDHGFIDRHGAWVIGPSSDYFWDFSEGLAAAAVQEGDEIKWGYVDKTGVWVIEPQFYMAGEFSEGLAAVTFLENGVSTYGYVDTTGKMVISPRLGTGAGPFSGGVAALLGLGSVNDAQIPSYIDKTGRVVWQGQ